MKHMLYKVVYCILTLVFVVHKINTQTMLFEPSKATDHVSRVNTTHNRIMKSQILNLNQQVCPPNSVCSDQGYCCSATQTTTCCGNGAVGACCNTTFSVCVPPIQGEPFYACCQTGYPVRCPRGSNGKACCTSEAPTCCTHIPTHAGCCGEDSVCIRPNGCCPRARPKPCYNDREEITDCCSDRESCCNGKCREGSCVAAAVTAVPIGAIIGGSVGGLVLLVFCCLLCGGLIAIARRRRQKYKFDDDSIRTSATTTITTTNIPMSEITQIYMTSAPSELVAQNMPLPPQAQLCIEKEWEDRNFKVDHYSAPPVNVVLNKPLNLIFCMNTGAYQELHLMVNPQEAMSDVIYNYCERMGIKAHHYNFYFYDLNGVRRNIDQNSTVRQNQLYDQCTVQSEKISM